ncbi:hypothetical protein FOZ60_005946 [Perkinsus olseni]|uniref:Uncharacterized protein n=1 Tax=Perkinsus olseni TaxID=32597 RepID=A0A7J6NQU1_PEROL|nr:hypothetical protein FOZ60_005946 [Perkinsus olseni]
MRASKQLLGLCILFQLVTSGNPTKEQRKPCLTPPTTTSPLGKGLEIYTQVALEFDGVDHSEMDSYVDKVLMNGTRNFILHNYRLHGSMIVFDKTFSQLDDWDKSRFMSLRDRVKAKGGKIVASLWWGPDHVSFKDFDKETFQSSVRKFVEIYPVDGFSVALERFDGDHLLIMGELIATFKKLGMMFMTKCNYYDWHRALKETGVPKMADLNVISLEPRFDDEVPDAERGLFLMDAIAEKAIKSATKAGVETDKLILGDLRQICRPWCHISHWVYQRS